MTGFLLSDLWVVTGQCGVRSFQLSNIVRLARSECSLKCRWHNPQHPLLLVGFWLIMITIHYHTITFNHISELPSAAGTEAAKHCANSRPVWRLPTPLPSCQRASECRVATGWVGVHMKNSKASECSWKSYRIGFLYRNWPVQTHCKNCIIKCVINYFRSLMFGWVTVTLKWKPFTTAPPAPPQVCSVGCSGLNVELNLPVCNSIIQPVKCWQERSFSLRTLLCRERLCLCLVTCPAKHPSLKKKKHLFYQESLKTHCSI